MFVFKQNTSYEMRICDWSSDVCSSDLDGFYTSAQNHLGAVGIPSAPNYLAIAGVTTQAVITFVDPADPGRKASTDFFGFDNAGLTDARSEESRDGTECVSPCRSR